MAGAPPRMCASRRPQAAGEADQNREWFENRHTWGANVGSREHQAAPRLTRRPGGAILRGAAFMRTGARSCEGERGGRDSLFVIRHDRGPDRTGAKRPGFAPNSLPLCPAGRWLTPPVHSDPGWYRLRTADLAIAARSGLLSEDEQWPRDQQPGARKHDVLHACGTPLLRVDRH